jgi:hypothetical protein
LFNHRGIPDEKLHKVRLIFEEKEKEKERAEERKRKREFQCFSASRDHVL